MAKTLREEFYGNELESMEVFEAWMLDDLKPRKQTVANILAYSRAMNVQVYSSLGVHEVVLN